MTQTHTNELLSRPLIDGIKTALSNSEKVMILINRRGFAPTIICQSCHRYFCCPECQLSYTYHQDKRLRCHRCATTIPVTNTCPNCRKPTLKFSGIGIQKVEAELKSLFSNHHITRLDKDIAKSANDIENILTEFKNNGDILLGTQLIAKGHDIPQVSMVGVIGIDTSLNLPDFKSTENAFQLLTQVSGRAGRQNNQGKVFIQTAYPDHYVFTHSKAHDSINFLHEELYHRKAMYYPPFCTLINIILSSPSCNDAKAYAQTLHSKLLEKLDTTPDLEILPVKPCPFEKIKNHYRVHIVLKCPNSNTNSIKDTIYHIIDNCPPAKRTIRTVIDYDAQQLL
jgi:primosomal protein N' (replication factor Y)